MNQALEYYSTALDILCVTSITMPDHELAICIRYGKCQRFLWHQLASESCEFHSKTIC